MDNEFDKQASKILREAYSKVYTEKKYCCGPDTSKKRLGSTRPARAGSERRLHSAVAGYRVGKGDPNVIRPQRNPWAISGDEEDISDISAERWGREWDITEFPPQLKQAIKEFEVGLVNLQDASVFDLKDIVDEIVAAKVLDDDVKEQAIGYLKQRAEEDGQLEDFELYGEKGIFSGVEEDKDFHDEQRDQDPHRHTPDR